MTAGDDTLIRRFADDVQRRGMQIVLRRVSRLAGNSPQPNPPTLVAPVLDDNAAAGATTIWINAAQAVGRILQGDLLAIGTLAPIAVAATVTARAPALSASGPITPGFDSVRLASALPQAVAGGTPIVPTWQADQTVWAMPPSGFPLALQNDQIVAGDVQIIIPAFGVAMPNSTDQILIGSEIRSIVNVDRRYVRGLVAAWLVHAR